MAPHSSTLAWKIPWMEEPGRLQSMGSWRVGYDWVTSLSLFTFMHWRRKVKSESWWAAVYGVAQSRTRLKRLSSSSSRHVYYYLCRLCFYPSVKFLLLCHLGYLTSFYLLLWTCLLFLISQIRQAWIGVLPSSTTNCVLFPLADLWEQTSTPFVWGTANYCGNNR